MRRFLVVMVGVIGAVTTLAAWPATPTLAAPGASPQAQASCQFVLGFATMRNLAGPSTVGECLENERENPSNGNAEQLTSGGLLVWRATDQMMAFTDGVRTWVNGPNGLVNRLNTQRFPWEGDRQLVDALRRGGHFIYIRHATTDRAQQDSDPNNLANCATQRNLTDQRRAQARAMGEAFRGLNIPVGQVLSSEYCRALEHARLSFGRVEAEPSLVLPDPLTAEQRQGNTAALLRLLVTPPAPGVNMVMVSHPPNIRDAAGVDLPVEGGAAILRPNPGDKPTLVARLRPEEWTELAQVMREF